MQPGDCSSPSVRSSSGCCTRTRSAASRATAVLPNESSQLTEQAALCVAREIPRSAPQLHSGVRRLHNLLSGHVMVPGRALILMSLLARVGVAQHAITRPARLIDVHLHVWDSLPTRHAFRDSLLAAFDVYHLERAVASGALTPVRALAALA